MSYQKKLTSSTTPLELAEILGTNYSKIKYFYYERNISDCYLEFEIPKKSGGKRKINAPIEMLKALQRKIARLLSQMYFPHDSAKGFVEKRSILDNAKEHTRRSFVFNVDIEDFFPSITFPRVRGLLMAKPYSLSRETATVIAHLCTLNGSLPQGAPSSPIISNMICYGLDKALRRLASQNRAQYTRYVDDITFSFYCPIDFLPSSIVCASQNMEGEATHYYSSPGDSLKRIFTKNRFSINPEKTRLQCKHERQIVTGLVVNKKVNVDRRFVRKTSAMIFSIEKDGVEKAGAVYKLRNPDSHGSIESIVLGRLSFIRQIQGAGAQVYRRLAVNFNDLPLNSKVKIPLKNEAPKSGVHKSYAHKCWLLTYEDFEKNYESKGSAFMIQNQLIVTCAHVVEDPADPKKFINDFLACRITDQSKEYKTKVLVYDRKKDIAILKIDSSERFEFFKIHIGAEASIGEKVSVLGFPAHKRLSSDVNRIWARVTNRYNYLGDALHSRIDKILIRGNSGGPVLNSSEAVVGIAAQGTQEGDDNSFIEISVLQGILDSYSLG